MLPNGSLGAKAAAVQRLLSQKGPAQRPRKDLAQGGSQQEGQMVVNKPPKKGVILAALAVAAGLWLVVRLAGPSPEVVEMSAPPQLSLLGLAAKPEAAKSPGRLVMLPGSWGRDPFALPYGVVLPGGPVAEEPQVEKGGPEEPQAGVTAILISGGRRLAVVGGEIVGEGDLVGGEKVVRISADRVVLSGSRGRRVLEVRRPQTQVSSQPAGSEGKR